MPRADEARGLDHALNRGNLRTTIFHEEGDFVAFEKILSEGLETYQVERFRDQLMPNHDQLVLRPLVDGELSRFMKWMDGTQTIRSHPHDHTDGLGMSTNNVTRVSPSKTLIGSGFCRYVKRNA